MAVANPANALIGFGFYGNGVFEASDNEVSFDGWVAAEYLDWYGTGRYNVGGLLSASLGYDFGGGAIGAGAILSNGFEFGTSSTATFNPYAYIKFGDTSLTYGYTANAAQYMLPVFKWDTGFWAEIFGQDSYSLTTRLDTVVFDTNISASYNEHDVFSFGLSRRLIGSLALFAALDYSTTWGYFYYGVGVTGGNSAAASSASLASASLGSFGLPGLAYSIGVFGQDNSSLIRVIGQVDYSFNQRMMASLFAQTYLNGGSISYNYVASAQYMLISNLFLTAGLSGYNDTTQSYSMGIRQEF